MRRGFLGTICFSLQPAAGREIDLATDDRFYAVGAALLVEFDRAEEITVIAQRQRRHLQLGGAPGQFRDSARSVEQAVLGVDVKMNEGFGRGHGSNLMPFYGAASRTFWFCIKHPSFRTKPSRDILNRPEICPR